MPPISGFNLSQFDGLSGSPGKSQKEGQEDQGTLKQLGGPPSSLRLYKPYKALIKKNKEFLKIFRNIQKVALPDRLPARLAAYMFWSLLLLLLMLLLGAVGPYEAL